MREERLKIIPFEDMVVLDYQSTQEINEHAKAKVSGRIPFAKKEEYINMGKQQTWVQVVALAEEGNVILFYGIMEELYLEINAQTCMVHLTLYSGTKLMDIKKHIRSFQNEKILYKTILEICNKQYPYSAKIMTEGMKKAIPHFLIQYQETDWEFIKRIAAMNHTIIFADCLTKGEKYHFGIPNRTLKENELSKSYQLTYALGEYWIKKSDGLTINPEDSLTYIWESREFHKLGERQNKEGKDFYIWKIESAMKGNELYHTCYMKSRSGFQIAEYPNSYLAGISLFGRVVQVKDEKVQIQLFLDENKDLCGSCWFPFATIYSSLNGTGWYCMPEIGDLIRLYFPTMKEEDAYVVSAYHEEGEERRTHPECKFWRNKEGKEIQLSPERILLTNSDGTYIQLSDEKGIELVSQGSITVQAGGKISISSLSSSVDVYAEKRIQLKQGETEMDLGKDIYMQGARIHL